MKKLIFLLFFALPFCAGAQSITLASLDSVIKSMQKQIATLQATVAPVKAPLAVDATGSLTIATATPATGSIGAITGETLIDLYNQIAAIKTKLAALKATSTTTTTIQ